MNCDRVFTVLTRGPFPSGGPEDLAVERHLDGCTACWRLAEALRPAADIFQEAVPPAEARDLPGYWGPEERSRGPAPRVMMQQIAQSALSGPATHSAGAARPAAMLAPRARPTRTPVVAYPGVRRSTWNDAVQVAGFLLLVTTAACGLSWIFG